MRTNADECRKLGQIIAEKVNAYQAPACLMLPLKGISVISQSGQPFHDPEADAALFDAIRSHSTKEVIEVDDHINGDQFPIKAAEKLLELLK